MNLTVDISRRPEGFLEACVIQEGKRGINLLRGQMTKAQSARIKVTDKLKGHRITWTGCSPDEDLVRAEDKKVSTHRDEYGMGGFRGR